MLSSIKRFVALCLSSLVLCSCPHLCAQELSHIVPAETPASTEATALATMQGTAQDMPTLYEKRLWKQIGPTWIVGPGLTLVPTEYLADCMARLELTTNELEKKSLALPEQPAEFTERKSFLVPFVVLLSLGVGFAGGIIVTNCSK